MKNNKNQKTANYIAAFLVGAVISILLREVFDTTKKKTNDVIWTGLLGGVVGLGIYKLIVTNRKDNRADSSNEKANNVWSDNRFQNSHGPSMPEDRFVEKDGPIDSVKVTALWASIPYANRISKRTAIQYIKPNAGYEQIYEGKSSYGKLQNGISRSPHNWDMDEMLSLNIFPNISPYNMKKLIYYSKLTEDDVREIYEDGKTILDFTEFDINGDIKKMNIGIFGSDFTLVQRIEDDVKSMFYNKNLPQTAILSYDENSRISEDLHSNYAFQKEYYTAKIVPYIYKYINDFSQLDKIADVVKCYNFSNKADIPTYSFYGFMGGTQIVKFDYKIFKRFDGKYYLVDLKMIIQDLYGADQDDFITHKESISLLNPEKGDISCLNAFFWLQHHFGCSPFKTEVVFHDYLILNGEKK